MTTTNSIPTGTDLNNLTSTGVYASTMETTLPPSTIFYATLGDIAKYKETGDFDIMYRDESGKRVTRRFSEYIQEISQSTQFN